MNNLGQVVGYTQLPGQTTGSGFLYSGATVSPLAGLAGDVFTIPASINDAGTIVGYGSDDVNGSHALLWDDGQVYNLNTLIPADSGWTLEAAYSIDTVGDIVGIGELDGQLQGFELTPSASPSSHSVPEPRLPQQSSPWAHFRPPPPPQSSKTERHRRALFRQSPRGMADKVGGGTLPEALCGTL